MSNNLPFYRAVLSARQRSRNLSLLLWRIFFSTTEQSIAQEQTGTVIPVAYWLRRRLGVASLILTERVHLDVVKTKMNLLETKISINLAEFRGLFAFRIPFLISN